MEIKTHPVQTYQGRNRSGRCPQVVTLRAYEVYKHVYGEQKAIIEGNCRGGFGTGELIAFLYTYSFPKNEWSMRIDEAMKGMENI